MASRTAMRVGWIVAVGLSSLDGTLAGEVVLESVRDNTLYEESATTSNGGGEHFFAGSTSNGHVRRGLLVFDLVSIPPGATVVTANLQLYCSKISPGSAPQTIALHRVSASWGEADSDGGLEEGAGADAQPGDATWTDRFFGQIQPWASPGGDFAARPSAGSVVPTPGVFYNWTDPRLAADVQAWIDDPASNDGWIVRGNETTPKTVRRFASRSSVDVLRPMLTVQFESVSSPLGAVPDGDAVPGAPLAVTRFGADELELSWDPACLPAADYAVYEGAIPDFGSAVTVACSTGGARTWQLAPAMGATFYLVVPVDPVVGTEGSYGRSSGGEERLPPGSPCFVQTIERPVCP